jgi:plastocyanin
MLNDKLQIPSSIAITVAVAAAVVALAPLRTAHAQSERPANGRAPSAEDFARLQQEMRDLRQMLIQAMAAEQQRYELMLRLLQSDRGAGALSGGLRAGGGGTAAPGSAAATPAGAEGTRRATAPGTPLATLTGTVKRRGGPGGAPIFVYVDELRQPAVSGRTVEIKQVDRQFSPQVLAVQRGTRVIFPNRDTLTHNVFSLSRASAFDLGMLKAGEQGAPIHLTDPGVVDVYCNIHAKMRAQVLVVPNRHFAKVDPDGSFRLTGVPVGQRIVVAWAPHSPPVRQAVELGRGGASVELVMQIHEAAAHNNKFGQSYGSYQD